MNSTSGAGGPLAAFEAAPRRFRIVTLAPNVPGPVAVARLRDLGAEIVKVEPPGGDPLLRSAPSWYADLHRDCTVLRLDLKTPPGIAAFESQLAVADVLLTSSRPSALARLGLQWDALHARYPRLIHVAIVGELPPNAERAGHDLTYVARLGLLAPPAMPQTLLADLAGAERAVSAVLGLLLQRERGGGAGTALVSLRDAARTFVDPSAHGLTAAGGVLSGAFAGYGVYRSSDGWIAIAALEPHFWQGVCDGLGIAGDAAPPALAVLFARRTSAEWEAWAAERDLPICALVRESVAPASRS